MGRGLGRGQGGGRWVRWRWDGGAGTQAGRRDLRPCMSAGGHAACTLAASRPHTCGRDASRRILRPTSVPGPLDRLPPHAMTDLPNRLNAARFLPHTDPARFPSVTPYPA